MTAPLNPTTSTVATSTPKSFFMVNLPRVSVEIPPW
jgi:hypothetical protein